MKGRYCFGRVNGAGLDSSGLGHVPVGGYCEAGNEISDSRNAGNFLIDKLSACQELFVLTLVNYLNWKADSERG